MASTGISLVPQAKNVIVFKNGDPFFTGRKLVVNQRQILTFESFLNEVTNNINAPVAVRNIYTPSGGHRVLQLNDLQNGCHYVAAGFERFKKIEFLSPGSPRTLKLHLPKCTFRSLAVPSRIPLLQKGVSQVNAKLEQVGTRPSSTFKVRAVYSNRVNISARWRKYIPIPCIVNIFRNGDLLNPPFRLIIPKHVMTNWDKILAMITEKANIRTGAVRRLCTMDGQLINNGAQLESGQYYVAVGSEKFKNLPYLELLVCKMPSQNACRSQQMIRHKNHSKEYILSQDGVSDSALLSSAAKSDKRRVQSTGDAGTAQVLVSPRTVRGKQRKNNSQKAHSIFFAKPVKVKSNRNLTKNSQLGDDTKDDRSVFKVNEKRAELQGAQEIPDDENTKVELPLDKRVAEIVEDEVIPEEETYHVEELGNTYAEKTLASEISRTCSSLHNVAADKLLNGSVFGDAVGTVCASNGLDMAVAFLGTSVIPLLLQH
ncbi:doublecortin domain-containing protein 2B [Carcharodon carcharias]|uniref:doublecortin domain-containing protein 2B n=1 Tax=Carcharodon carcharias TaxID=13397 RepID=UPI001B7E151E|nr:doublecortin domain-containing protein 2B [Carcharodon carcharias]